MKPFSRNEIKIILSILTVLFVVSGFNLSISLRRGRDATRKNDISAIQGLLDTYYQKHYTYPLSNDSGQVVGCFNDTPNFDIVTNFATNAVVCSWGESIFEDGLRLPRDPSYKEGTSYKYISDGYSYSIYISLEGKDEAEYTQSINDKNLQCGTKICNYGREVL